MKIRDVAEAAGVSIATVSRVLNHPELVTQETRERIQEIISKNNYAPNTEQRQTKRTKKKQVIAVILPSFELYRNLYSGVHQICAAKKYCVQMYLIEDNPDDLKRIVKNIENGFADGVIIALEVMNSYVKEKLNENNIPYVCVGGERGEMDGNLCYINYYDSACKMSEYLGSLRLRQVLLLLSNTPSGCREQLKQGFADTWKGKMDVHYAEKGLDGYRIFLDMLEEGVRPEAVVTQHDEIAFGIIKAAREKGIQVPQEMKIVGFDNSQLSTMVTPELTTVEQPTFRLGILAGRRLFDIMEDQEYFDIEVQEIALKGRLKIRRSCGNQKSIYEEIE